MRCSSFCGFPVEPEVNFRAVRVVKGFAFHFDPFATNPAVRGDIYFLDWVLVGGFAVANRWGLTLRRKDERLFRRLPAAVGWKLSFRVFVAVVVSDYVVDDRWGVTALHFLFGVKAPRCG